MKIIGLDLSFSSTGITIANVDVSNNVFELMFHRIISKDNSMKEYKYINTDYYTFDIKKVYSHCLNTNDVTEFMQLKRTIQAICCAKKVAKICIDNISVADKSVYICIENYIMPSFGGKNNLSNVSGLILLQGYVRQLLLAYCEKNDIKCLMLLPPPTSVKKLFTEDGNADKEKMVQSFLYNYDGNKLLPTVGLKDVANINDVVDSFALMCYAYYKHINSIL